MVLTSNVYYKAMSNIVGCIYVILCAANLSDVAFCGLLLSGKLCPVILACCILVWVYRLVMLWGVVLGNVLCCFLIVVLCSCQISVPVSIRCI